MSHLSSLTLLTALALAGASSARTTSAQASPQINAQAPTLLNTTWTLTGLTDAGRLLTPGQSTPRPTLRLDARTASGNTGCNIYRAVYASRGEVLRFGSLARTRRACPDRPDALEARFVNLLSQVTRYRLSGQELTLFAGKADRLTFTAAGAAARAPRPEATMTAEETPSGTQADGQLDRQLGGTWTLIGGTALRPLPAQTTAQTPSLTFAGERVSGTGGCNRVMGPVQARGDALAFGPLATTRMLCAPAVNAQEQAFLTFLGRAGLRASVQAQRLTLTAPDGRTLIFRRAGLTGAAALEDARPTPPAPAAAEGTYTLSRVNGQPAPPTPRPVTLSLEEGRIGGSDGCNSFGGDYRLEGGAGEPRRLNLTGPLVGTLRACPEPDGAPDLQSVLRARPTVTFTADTLTLSANGTTLTFSR